MEGKAQRTAGDWVVSVDNEGAKTVVLALHVIPITGQEVLRAAHRPTVAEAEANARLGAAAPELLEALRGAEQALNKIRVCCQHTAWDATGPAVIAARAAIARATGGAA